MLPKRRTSRTRARLRHPNHSRGLVAAGLWVCRGLALLWVAGWSAFTAYAAAPSFGLEPDLILPVALFGLGVLLPVLLAWVFPRFGGLVLVGLGVFAYTLVHSEASRVGVVVPAVSLGSAFLALGSAAGWQRWRTRRKALRIARNLERVPANSQTNSQTNS